MNRPTSNTRLMWTAYLALFVAYVALKVFAVPQAALAMNAEYLRSTAIVTAMTGLVPFLVGLVVMRQIPGAMGARLSLVGLVVLVCVGMYAAFWYFFIPNDPAVRPPLWDVARRGILPGLVMGAVLFLHPAMRGSPSD